MNYVCFFFTWKSSGSPPSAFQLPYDSFKEQLDSAAANDCLNKDEIEGSRLKDLDYDFACFFLSSPRLDLYRSIDFRCEDMLLGMLFVSLYFLHLL